MLKPCREDDGDLRLKAFQQTEIYAGLAPMAQRIQAAACHKQSSLPLRDPETGFDKA